MRLFRIVYVAFILILCCSLSAQASDDSEYWSAFKFSAKVNEKVKLNLLEEFRMKSNMGNFYTYVQYGGATCKVSDYFDTAVWYKLVSSKSSGNWSESHRFDIDGTLKSKLDEFKLSNRARLERNTTASSWLYRDKISIERTFELFNRNFTPFISNEFFYDLEPHSGYHENRGSVGFSTDLIWGSKLSIYYMSRAKKSGGDWNSANVFGTTVGVNF